MQVTKLDEDELFHTVPGFESDMTLPNPSRTSSEATYATYARVPRPMVEDGYGKLIPRMPNYPTLDGLSFEEWDKKQEQEAQQAANPEPAAAKPSESVARGHFVIRNFCRVCWCEQDLSVCPCGNSDLYPVLVKR